VPQTSPTRRRPPAGADPSTRERILDVALEAFSQLGFDGASTRAIAQGAGINQGLIPYYFGTKDALWREAVERAFAQLRDVMARIDQRAEQLSGRERFALMIRRYVHFVAGHPEFVRLMNEEGKRDGPRARWLTERHVRPMFAQLESVLEAARVTSGMPAGVEIHHVQYIFIGAVATIFHQAHECRNLTGRDPTTPDAVRAHADALVHLFLGDASLARDLDALA
jgi:AcrR family transcriptional regulator